GPSRWLDVFLAPSQPRISAAMAFPPDASQRPAHGCDQRHSIPPGRAYRSVGAAAGPHPIAGLRGLAPCPLRYAGPRHHAVPPCRHLDRPLGLLAPLADRNAEYAQAPSLGLAA